MASLELGVEGIDNTRGHMNHSIGSRKLPRGTTRHQDQLNELNLEGVNLSDAANDDLRDEFLEWIANKAGAFGQVGMHNFGYNFDTFKSVATPRLGGNRADGGGADNEFHIALRLVAHFTE